ncbi:VOC family protein [Frigidibacter sp. ROC022]|uniref:VOC family protein n=1 Tax=Frigidibacter sp. ROC022 TaxID=2971796 RepID=UPI00215A5FC8|nr:VOC family protein [Frigidibacter sp. ROC022]MCR8723255.1 VOC family protein [Frigidibacter sp. ROC022]
MTATLEHVNLTVSDPEAFAEKLCELFDWKIRWKGPAIAEGFSVHVGGPETYLAVYSGPNGIAEPGGSSYATRGGLNHVGFVVDDLDAMEERVRAAGFTPRSHADYEPGRRFYFDGPEGVEFELVSYA